MHEEMHDEVRLDRKTQRSRLECGRMLLSNNEETTDEITEADWGCVCQRGKELSN